MLEAGLFPSMRWMADLLRPDAGDVSRAMTLARLPEPLLQAMAGPRALALHDASRLNALIERGSDSVIEIAAKSVKRQGRITPKTLMRCLETVLASATADVPQAEPATITVQGRAVGSEQVDHTGGLTIKVSAVIRLRRHGEVKKEVADLLQRLLGQRLQKAPHRHDRRCAASAAVVPLPTSACCRLHSATHGHRCLGDLPASPIAPLTLQSQHLIDLPPQLGIGALPRVANQV